MFRYYIFKITAISASGQWVRECCLPDGIKPLPGQTLIHDWWVSKRYNDVIMSAMASEIPSLTIFTQPFYSGTDERRHQSSASLAFVRGIHHWPVNSPHKGPVTWKIFPSDDVIKATRNQCILLATPLHWIYNDIISISHKCNNNDSQPKITCPRYATSFGAVLACPRTDGYIWKSSIGNILSKKIKI